MLPSVKGPHEIGKGRAVVSLLIKDRRCLSNDFLSGLLTFGHVAQSKAMSRPRGRI
jgi:hypothetical protein